jgi:diguanylate cyclase (GGDEF)-like protein
LFEQAVKTETRHQKKCAVLFVDLDQFKGINDSLGHAAGDTLLVEIAHRLRASLRASDVVARLGGDEFVVLLYEVTDAEQVAGVARKILTNLEPAVSVAGHQCRTTASIGIAMFPDHGSDAMTLTKYADLAMYLAKAEGKNGFRFFSPENSPQSSQHGSAEGALCPKVESPELQPENHAFETGQRKPLVA